MLEEESYFMKDLGLCEEWAQFPRGVVRWLPELQNSWRRVDCHMTQSTADWCSTGQKRGLGVWGEKWV